MLNVIKHSRREGGLRLLGQGGRGGFACWARGAKDDPDWGRVGPNGHPRMSASHRMLAWGEGLPWNAGMG